MKKEEDKCCDKCVYYEWYYDKCTKWDTTTDFRSCCSTYESRESSNN